MSRATKLVERVEAFKIAADPHPKRVPLPKTEIESIAECILQPLGALVAYEAGRRRDWLWTFGKREPVGKDTEETTLCLPSETHHLVSTAAKVSRRTKRELVQDLLESAGAMGQVAGLWRQGSSCGENGVTPSQIVDSWIQMLLAVGCISDDSDRGLKSKFRDGLLKWYDRHSHPGVETVRVASGRSEDPPLSLVNDCEEDLL